MSWLELDDRILEHPKFIRAVKIGGSEAIHLWLGLRAYCGQQLSDGLIPSDMLDEVRGPTDPKRRAKALDALRVSGLVDDDTAGVRLHDFLDWSTSRAEVEERRAASRERQRKSRRRHAVTDAVTDGELRRESQPPAGAPARSGEEWRGSESSEGVQGEGGKVRCPPDLRLTDDELGALSIATGIARWQADAMAAVLVAKFQSHDTRPLESWRRTLVTAIALDWTDQAKRPTKPEPTDAERRKRSAANDAAFAALVASERAERGVDDARPVEESKSAVAAVLAAARANSARGAAG